MFNMFKKKYLDLIFYSFLTYLALGAIYPERFIFAEIKFTSNHTLANIYQAALFHAKYIANLNFTFWNFFDHSNTAFYHLAQGFYNFCISVHYLASQIKDYFEDGSKLGVKISYIEEKEPLGTAGAIALMHPQPTDSFLVTNGDLISSIQFDNLLSYHKENKASASMSVFLYKFENPFGIVKTNGILIDGFEEKPVSKHNINAGVYVFEPEIIKFLKKYQKYDIPTLFNLLKEKNKRIIAYFVHENWLDIGKPEDLDKINKQLGT